jgi:hypothetical protein
MPVAERIREAGCQYTSGGWERQSALQVINTGEAGAADSAAGGKRGEEELQKTGDW